MKKLLLPLLALTVVVLSSCSDNKTNPKPSEIVKGVYDATKLALKIEGADATAAKLTLETVSETAVNITLENAIFGYDKIVANAIPVANTKADTYYIKGSSKIDDLTLTFDGSVTNGVMTMAISQAYEAPFVGVMTPTLDMTNPTDPQPNCVHASLVTPKTEVILLGNTIPTAKVTPFLKMILGGYIAPEVQTVTFTANGTYSVAVNATLPFPIAGRYSYKKGVVSLELPAGAIAMLKNLNIPAIANIKSLDLLYKQDKTQNIFYVNKDMMLPFFPIIKGLLPPVTPGMKPTLMMMISAIGDFEVIITDATSFELGLNLTKK